MVTIELYPPLSFEFTSERTGSYTFSVKVGKNETLSDLLIRLCQKESDRWEKLYNIKTGRMKGPVITVINGKTLPSSALVSTELSDDDHIVFKLLLSGG